MKIVLSLLVSSLCICSILAGPWDDFSIKPDKNNRTINLFGGKKLLAMFRDLQQSGLVAFSAKDGILHVDATRFQKQFPGKPLDIYYFLTAAPGENAVVEIELAGPEGATVDLFFDGRTDKHYWKKQSVVLKKELTRYRFEIKFPENLAQVSFRVSFTDIPELKIGDFSYRRESMK